MRFYGHEIDGSSMATLFPMMMHAHLAPYGVMIAVVGLCGSDCCEHRDGRHGGENDCFHICGIPFVEEGKARFLAQSLSRTTVAPR